jgi:hypothetical protein
MACLPDALAGTVFYEPTSRGTEARIAERLAEIRRRVRDDREQAEGGEAATSSPPSTPSR